MESESARATRLMLVAQKYYLNGKSKSQIAEDLDISRFTVARLLDEAVESGLVSISIAGPPEWDPDLGSAVERKFGLRRVLVVRPMTESRDADLGAIGRAAAVILASVVTADDVLGLSWGRALASMVAAAPPLPPCLLVQLVGGVSPTGHTGSMDLVRRLADNSGGDAFSLYAPLIVATATLAGELRSDALVRTTTDLFARLTVAVVGVGSWTPPSSSLREVVGDAMAGFEAAGAVADVCASILDAAGNPLASSRALAERAISITWEQLQAVPHVIAVAGGVDKANAIRSVLRSGVVHTLITDAGAAAALLT